MGCVEDLFENGGNEATQVRWNQMGQNCEISCLKVAQDDLGLVASPGASGVVLQSWRVLPTWHMLLASEPPDNMRQKQGFLHPVLAPSGHTFP